jgi:hypothetical protein
MATNPSNTQMPESTSVAPNQPKTPARARVAVATNPPNTPAPAPTPAPANEQLPAYPASDRPVTRGDRIAFQIWMLVVLLTVVIALVLYLFDKIHFAVTGR